MQGRVEGRKSGDGQSYEIWQGDRMVRSIPLSEAVGDNKLLARIAQNKWEPVQ